MNTRVSGITAPTSWAALWDPANKDKLGLLALVSNSFLLEVTAKTFFGGTNALSTEDGLLKAFKKLAELKPNVRLWYRDEAQFEQWPDELITELRSVTSVGGGQELDQAALLATQLKEFDLVPT